ncbi:MAG: rane protein [Bacteroidetes bacterium]|nr:rane protein [Bacteroidota bacterium]
MTKKRKDQYKALTILWIGFSLIGWRFHQWWLMGVAGGLLIAGLLSTFILEHVTGAWKWLGEQMGAVSSRVILSIVFIVFLSPIAFFYRLFAEKKNTKTDESNFVERNHTYTSRDLEKVF